MADSTALVLRSRWAAIGAAIAVALGAGGIGISQATSDAGDGPVAAFFPIEPCRLADTRPGTIGPSATEVFDGWGVVGDCDLPSGTSGLALNVTAVDATAQTNLRLFPAGSDVPETANLNPTPGAPPTPNAVNVTLNGTNGQFAVFNRFGSVAVVIDVMGYYDDHTHDHDHPHDHVHTHDDRYEVVPDRFVIPGSAFAPSDEGESYELSATLRSSAGFGCFVAPIVVPEGTTIASITAAVSVLNAGDNIVLEILRETYAEGADATTGGDLLGTVGSGPIAADDVVVHLTVDSITAPTVDNSTYVYAARVCLNAPGGQVVALPIDAA